MAQKFPSSKMVLSETEFPTAGATSSVSGVTPSLAESVNFYHAVANWVPQTVASAPLKFWFSFFDRRPDDNSMGVDLEKHFGFFTYDRLAKSTDPDYPRSLSPTVTPTTAPTPTTKGRGKTTTAPTTAPPTSSTTSPPTTKPKGRSGVRGLYA